MTLLHKENASLQERNASMLEEMNKWRAESSAAARGNDNINSKFPFNREIIKSYTQLCDGSGDLWALLDIRDGDADPIEWACKVSSYVFRTVRDAAVRLLAVPRDQFKREIMAGDGDQEVAEWGQVLVHIIKLQRVTRTRILDWVINDINMTFLESARQHPDGAFISTLVRHQDYQKGSLEKCVAKLLEVIDI